MNTPEITDTSTPERREAIASVRPNAVVSVRAVAMHASFSLPDSAVNDLLDWLIARQAEIHNHLEGK